MAVKKRGGRIILRTRQAKGTGEVFCTLRKNSEGGKMGRGVTLANQKKRPHPGGGKRGARGEDPKRFHRGRRPRKRPRTFRRGGGRAAVRQLLGGKEECFDVKKKRTSPPHRGEFFPSRRNGGGRNPLVLLGVGGRS